jgi:hypothetical protein
MLDLADVVSGLYLPVHTVYVFVSNACWCVDA